MTKQTILERVRGLTEESLATPMNRNDQIASVAVYVCLATEERLQALEAYSCAIVDKLEAIESRVDEQEIRTDSIVSALQALDK